MTNKRIDFDDVSFHVSDSGLSDSGRGRVVLLVHGFPLDHTMWSGQIEALSDEYRVIAPDLRGFGGSSSSDSALAMWRFADDLAGILDRLEVAEPITFCGLSMGGYVAWEFLDRHPGRTDRLILCDTRAASDSPEAARGRLETAKRLDESGETDEFVEGLVERLFSERTRRERPETVDACRASMRAAAPHSVAAALRGMAQRSDWRDRLPGIDIPSLVICGQFDQITPVDEMKELAQRLPRGRYVEIPDAGHMSPMEDPRRVNRAILEFLK